MANKTDKIKSQKRSRVHTKCPPKLSLLLQHVNHFPEPEEMEDFVTGFGPSLRLALDPGWKDTKEFEEREINRQKENFELAQKMLDLLREKKDAMAAFLIASPEDWNKIKSVGQVWIDNEDDARNHYELAKAGKIQTTRDEIIRRVEKVKQCKKDYYQTVSQYSDAWLHRYYRIRSIKRLLIKLAYVAENFETAEKRLENSAIFEINNLVGNLIIDGNGILQREEDSIMEILIGVDVRRIKRCQICWNFFWAERLDRQCCEKKCANLYNQRLARQRKKENSGLYKRASLKRAKKKNLST